MSTRIASNSQSGYFGKISHRLAFVIGRLLTLLISVLLCLPVVLLPLTTSVPIWMWMLLALVDVALILLQFRFSRVSKASLGIAAGIIFVSLIAVAASQFFASTPAIRGTNGQPIPGSIASLEKVKPNGSEQWITIRGHDVNKPILLHLGMGGP